MGVLPGQIAREPAAFHLSVDKSRHGQSDPAMAAFLALIHREGEGVELAVGHPMNRNFMEGVTKSDGGEGVPREGERHPECR